MKIGIFFAAQAFMYTVYGIVVAELGLIQNAVDSATGIAEPESGGFLNQILAPFEWAWNAASILFQFISFQMAGVPTAISVPFGIAISILNLYLIYRAIRGGG